MSSHSKILNAWKIVKSLTGNLTLVKISFSKCKLIITERLKVGYI